MTAGGMELAAFQEGGIAHQEKALRGKRQRRSRRQAEDHRGAEIGNEVFGVAAQRRPCHGVGGRPGEDGKGNDAAGQCRFPERRKRRLTQQSMQGRYRVVCRSKQRNGADFQ